MNPPRIAICTAAVGCGHTQAARAVAEAISSLRPDAHVEIIEALDHAPRWFTATYRDGYLQAIARLPSLAGRLYHMTDRPPGRPGLGDALEARALRRLLALESIARADLILTTHFLCARVLSRAKDSRRLPARLGVIVTDQHPHGLWLVPQADQLLVASPDAATAAIAAGVRPERVHVAGIPVHPRFARTSDPATIRHRHRLPDDRPTLLLAGGGLGLGGMDRALASLLSSSGRFHVLAICGCNARLQASLTQLVTKTRSHGPTCEVIGYTKEMHNLMQVASLYVGKPGGLSTAECCARGLPMVLMRPIPGQEELNARRLFLRVRPSCRMTQPPPAVSHRRCLPARPPWIRCAGPRRQSRCPQPHSRSLRNHLNFSADRPSQPVAPPPTPLTWAWIAAPRRSSSKLGPE